MKIFQHKITLLLCFVAFLAVVHGQTYLGISVGYDYTQINKGKNVKDEGVYDLYLLEDKYLAGSYFAGIMAEQQLSPKSYLSLNLSYYAKKDAPANWIGVFAPARALRINLFRIKTLFKQEILDNFHVGAGLGVGFNTVRVVYKSGNAYEIDDLIPKNISYDSHFVVGYNYRHFLWELGYQKGLGYQKDYSYFVRPMNAFNLTMSYLFKMPSKNKKKNRNARF